MYTFDPSPLSIGDSQESEILSIFCLFFWNIISTRTDLSHSHKKYLALTMC